MCGIAGFVGGRSWEQDGGERVIRAMMGPLAHRGPDGEDRFVDAEVRVALGHRRLAILDLTPNGSLPRASACGRYLLTYNGEVYNYLGLRTQLRAEGVHFRGTSDSETILEWIAHHGLDSLLERAEGMFAFAVWDRAERHLILARDHAGIKPLFWTTSGGGVAFASELKSLLAWPDFDGTIDRTALTHYLRYGYVPAPLSIYASARKVEPGEMLTFDSSGLKSKQRYWQLSHLPTPSPKTDRWSDEEAIAATDRVVTRAIRDEMISDVPVGCFLSGGIDSSLIAAVMAQNSQRPLRTYAAGFDEQDIDESRYAEAVADALGCHHTTVRILPKDVEPVLAALAETYDDPLSDMASLPTFLISQRARQDVAVVLSGDGGDEAFGGYDRYARGLTLMAHSRQLPAWSRHLLGRVARGPFKRAVAFGVVMAGKSDSMDEATRRIERYADSIGEQDRRQVYRALTSLWNEAALLTGAEDCRIDQLEEAHRTAAFNLDYFQRSDLATYLPDALFTKTDRASMAHGLEARVPLASKAVLNHAFQLPERFRRRDGTSKWLLREVCFRHLDRKLVDRPKKGFGVPMAGWLRGPLRDWAESLLSTDALHRSGLFDPVPVRRRWREHIGGKIDWSYSLWAILVAQDWARHHRARI